MRFSKEELKNIIIVLEESDILAENEDRAAQKMSQWLAAVVDDSDCDECYDLINKDHYVATTLWTFESIKDALKEKGFRTTDENADLVYADLIPEAMEDYSAGCEHIYATIDRLGEIEILERESRVDH